jgi:ATP-dependent phosphofructokinase / diphosphate-dependent phosphofructokinase
MPALRRLGVLTGGGDAPGLNAVIRAVVKSACNRGVEVVGLEDSFDGLIEPDRSSVLTPRDVTGILRLGGTILGTTNRGNPFAYPVATSEGVRDYSDRVVDMFHRMGLDALIVIGGDGTLAIAHRFCERGIHVVGVPKTIDNDIWGTMNCFGFDTAVDFATEAIDRLHTTAEAHHRTMVVEVMGRYAGWIALYAGVAGGADAILIPEIPFDIDIVAERLLERERWGARFSVVVVAEGAFPKGGRTSLVAAAHEGHVERLGGMGAQVTEALGTATGKETRCVVLGHLQRGGAPTSFDRVLATRFGGKAVELAINGEFGTMVAYAPPDIVARRLGEVVGKTKTVPMDHDLIATARAVGVTFGD